MQWLLAYAVNLVIYVLETAFKKDPRFSASQDAGSNNKESHIFDEKDSNTSKAIQEAYEFMELTPPCTKEEVKKKYKKLSLRHHPDRNGGSQESQEMMQKLNACLAIVEKDLLKGSPEDHDNDNADSFDDSEELPDYEEMQREMEKAMEEEMERHRQKRKDFQEHKNKDKNDCHRKQNEMGLQTDEGRMEAHVAFCQQVKEQEQKQKQGENKNNKDGTQDQDEKKTAGSEETTDSKTANVKPQNYIMDYNVDDMVVALRLDMPEIAIELLQEKINKYIQQRALDARMTGEFISMSMLGIEFLKLPLDFDDNALLHYAVYYESYQVVNALCGIAQRFKGLDSVLYQANKYGQTPLTFAKIAKDESIRALIQLQVDNVQTVRTKTQFIPAVKAAVGRLGSIIWNVDVVGTCCTLGAFFLGYKVFNLHKITAIIAVIFMQFGKMLEEEEDAEIPADVKGVASVTLLMSFCCTWVLLRWSIAFILQFVMVELLLIMAPFTIAALISVNRRRTSLLERLLLPFSVVSRYLEKVLMLFHVHITPSPIKQRASFVKPFFLILVSLVAVGTKHLLLHTTSK